MDVIAINSLGELLEHPSYHDSSNLVVVNFFSPEVDACTYMNEVFLALAASCSGSSATFFQVNALSVGDVTLHYRIEAVPTFILVRGGKEIERLSGTNPEELVKTVGDILNEASDQQRLNSKLAALIKRHQIMIFIKGTPNAPRCGFTRQLLELFSQQGITDFDYFDILQDEQVRQGLKDYSKWPTYPQIYVHGELIGGLDIFRELVESGQLQTLLERE
jgi:Grx4 family monothiol glutaredoxin